jgi:hypothetical protein
MRIWLLRDQGGTDFGAQWIMAHPLEGIPGELQVSDFSKAREYEIVTIVQNGSAQVTRGSGNTTIRYRATVSNVGGTPVHFTVQGGGNV